MDGLGKSDVRLGVLGTTRFLTPEGMRPAQHLGPGAWLTGMVPAAQVLAVKQVIVPRNLGAQDWPMLVPGPSGAGAVMLPPDQPILIPWQDEVTSLIPARALEGWGRVTRAVPSPGVPAVQIFLEGPALVPSESGIVIALPDEAGRYTAPVLAMAAARALVAKQVAVEAGKGLALARLGGAVQAALRAPPPKRA